MEFFGLDIGTYSVKLVQLEKRGQKYRLMAFGIGPSTGKGLLSEAENDLAALAEVVKKIRQEAKIKTKNVATALPQDQVFTRTVVVPKLSEEELQSALNWEAEQFIPVPLTEVTLAHQIVGQIKEGKKEKNKVLLVAASNRLVQKIIKVLEMAGLNPVSLETEIISMARSLIVPDGEPIMMVDLGARASDLAIVEAGQVTFVNSIGTAGETLTRVMETQLGLDPTQAEAYKKAYGADPKKLEGKLAEALDPILEKIVREMEKTIQFHQSQGGKRIGLVVLTGGTAGLPEIASILASKLNLEVQLGDPFGQIAKGDLASRIPGQSNFLFSVAVGLAMKEIA